MSVKVTCRDTCKKKEMYAYVKETNISYINECKSALQRYLEPKETHVYVKETYMHVKETWKYIKVTYVNTYKRQTKKCLQQTPQKVFPNRK